MRRKQGNIVSNPFIAEFLYDLLYSITPTQRRALPAEYAKVAQTPKKAKQFTKMSSFEEKLHLMSCLGIQWALVLHHDEMKPHNFKEILKKYQSEKPAAGLKEMSAEKLYVTCDREFMHLMVAMAQSIHNPRYTLSLEWNKLGYKLNQWGAWTKSAENADYTTAVENIEAVDKYSLMLEHYDRTMESISSVFGIRHVDFRILNFLYRNKSVYVTQESIYNYLTPMHSKLVLRAAIKKIQGAQLLQVNPYPGKHEYTITALGIDLVQKVFTRILKGTNF